MTFTDPCHALEASVQKNFELKDQEVAVGGARGRTLKDELTLIVDELVRRGITLTQARREFERQFIEASIRSNDGNLGRSAQCLGVHRNTLRNKVTDLGIRPEEVLARSADQTGGGRRNGRPLTER